MTFWVGLAILSLFVYLAGDVFFGSNAKRGR